MAAVRRRRPPKTDAEVHAAQALDKTEELEVKYINSFKGRGVFAKAHIHKGDFVVEYRGELINSEESQRRRRTYHVRCTVFMFDFHWQERTWCIDAAREDGSLGRLVNDDHNHPNCKMKKVISEGKPHLCLFALRDINVGEEITYDYGGTDWPWREKVGGPSTVTESSDCRIAATQDQDPERSSCSQNQVGGPSTVTRSRISRTKDQDPERSSCSQNQVGGSSTVTECSDSDISATQDQDPKRSSCSQNQTELNLSEQDQECVPMLKRTKCLQMNHSDSDELVYSTSADSGEEYIPKSSEDYSDGTDTSEVLEPVHQTERMFKSLCLKTVDDIRQTSVSLTEVNNGSSKNVADRGRSPSRKASSSGLRHKRQRLSSVHCPKTQTTSGQSSEQSGKGDTGTLLENSTLELEKSPLDSNSSLDSVAGGSLYISAVSKKEDGSRIYDKKQYCVYCKLGVGKMARHLERAHKNKPEVAQALSFPKGSKERRMHLELLRNRGNFAHNVDVLNSGVGNLVPRKQPKQDCQAKTFLHCIYCHGFFTKKVLWRHMTSCKFKPDASQKPGKTRVQALCAFAAPPPPGVKVEFWKLLSNMIQDNVYSAVKSDVCIMEFGEHLYNRLGYDVGKHEYIRQKLRELGRLLECSRKTTPMKTIEDHIKPVNFMHVVEAVKRVAGYDSKTDAYKRPSLALKIGHSLTKISMLVESRASVQSNHSAAKDARTFRRVYETRWNELISTASLRTLQESKWNAPLLLPFTKDVQTLHSYLDVQQRHSYSKLSTETSPQAWTQLAKVTLTQVLLFNRRRAGEVSKMPLSAYLSQNPTDPEEDVNIALSDLEKKLCQHFRRIEIRGKRGRKVPVLLTPAMQKALDLLVSKREECGVLQNNIYLFARPSAFTCYRGSDCLRHFARVCGTKSPESLTSTKLRKQTATLSQILNLSNTELDQLADFLGHDIRVHRQFYRLPEGTLQLAKISKVLMALEQGRLAQFKGKSLDDISIDPDENVHMDSDTEVACESDSQETQEAITQREEDETTSPDVSHSDARSCQHPMTPPQACHHQSPKKKRGRQPSKKRMWEKEEVVAVEKHMMSFITSCRVPGKSDCDKCLQQEKVALKNRNWLAIKFYIKNRITALKNKF